MESISAAGVSTEPGGGPGGGSHLPHQGPPPPPPLLLLASPCPYAIAYTRVAHCYAGLVEVCVTLQCCCLKL